MPKQPSEATQIRNLKCELREAYADLTRARRERDHHAAKAHMLQTQVQEWKDRFDTLLRAARINVSDEKKP